MTRSTSLPATSTTPGRGDRAVAQLLRVADRAEAVFANEAAMVHLRRALELLDEEDGSGPRESGSRETVVLRLADLCDLVGSYEEATRHYRSLLDGPLGPRATCGLSASVRNRGEYDDALAILDAASAYEMSKQEEAALWLERGRALDGRQGVRRRDRRVHVGARGRAGRQPGGGLAALRPRARRVVGRAASTTRSRTGSRLAARSRRAVICGTSRARCACSAACTRISAGSTTRLTALSTGLALAERTGRVDELGGCLINLGLVELARGRIDEAIACDRRAIDAFERLGHPARATAYANLAEALLARGELAEVRTYCEKAIAVASQQNDSLAVADASLTAAIADLRSGRALEAANTAGMAAELFVEVDAREWAVKALGVAAEAWESAGDASRATAARERARELG